MIHVLYLTPAGVHLNNSKKIKRENSLVKVKTLAVVEREFINRILFENVEDVPADEESPLHEKH